MLMVASSNFCAINLALMGVLVSTRVSPRGNQVSWCFEVYWLWSLLVNVSHVSARQVMCYNIQCWIFIGGVFTQKWGRSLRVVSITPCVCITNLSVRYPFRVFIAIICVCSQASDTQDLGMRSRFTSVDAEGCRNSANDTICTRWNGTRNIPHIFRTFIFCTCTPRKNFLSNCTGVDGQGFQEATRQARLLDPPRALFPTGMSSIRPQLVWLGPESDMKLVCNLFCSRNSPQRFYVFVFFCSTVPKTHCLWSVGGTRYAICFSKQGWQKRCGHFRDLEI